MTKPFIQRTILFSSLFQIVSLKIKKPTKRTALPNCPLSSLISEHKLLWKLAKSHFQANLASVTLAVREICTSDSSRLPPDADRWEEDIHDSTEQRIHRVKPIHSKIKDLFVSDAVKRQWKRGRWCFTQFLYCMFPHLKIPPSGHIPNLGTCPNQNIDLASSQNMSKSQCSSYLSKNS